MIVNPYRTPSPREANIERIKLEQRRRELKAKASFKKAKRKRKKMPSDRLYIYPELSPYNIGVVYDLTPGAGGRWSDTIVLSYYEPGKPPDFGELKGMAVRPGANAKEGLSEVDIFPYIVDLKGEARRKWKTD